MIIEKLIWRQLFIEYAIRTIKIKKNCIVLSVLNLLILVLFPYLYHVFFISLLLASIASGIEKHSNQGVGQLG